MIGLRPLHIDLSRYYIGCNSGGRRRYTTFNFQCMVDNVVVVVVVVVVDIDNALRRHFTASLLLF